MLNSAEKIEILKEYLFEIKHLNLQQINSLEEKTM